MSTQEKTLLSTSFHGLFVATLNVHCIALSSIS